MENEKDNTRKKGPFSPDPETLHSSDPQQYMRGPFSSRVNEVDKVMHKPENTEPPYTDERDREGADPWKQ
ncbi:MAG: hypothetical protein EOO11_19255 [Chitinophagaceae bacterium]|nr:MAG: hypothetical protein EOO11_19255 [Chitinophagaceae bacterium]